MSSPADLVLSPTVRLLWRSDRTVQLELGDQAVIVDGMDERTLRRLSAGRGSSELGPPPGHDLARVLATLYDAGFLWTRTSAKQRARTEIPRHLLTELSALSTRHGEQAGQVLDRRRAASVVLQGTGRLVAHVGAVLAAAGVGHVYVADTCDVAVEQTMPGGLCPDDEGQRFASAASAAILRAAPQVATGGPRYGEPPDLVVVVTDGPADPQANGHRAYPHLMVRVAGDHGVVGPLVLPGLTSCLRCADLHRTDRDHAWAALAVQLSAPRSQAPASDVSLAAVMAGIAAIQVLAFLDGEHPASIEGSLESAFARLAPSPSYLAAASGLRMFRMTVVTGPRSAFLP